jgi:hypothetical protein
LVAASRAISLILFFLDRSPIAIVVSTQNLMLDRLTDNPDIPAPKPATPDGIAAKRQKACRVVARPKGAKHA